MSITAGSATGPNWSGYVVQGGYRNYDNVVGYWHVPFAGGESGHNTRALFWVGLDGYTGGARTTWCKPERDRITPTS